MACFGADVSCVPGPDGSGWLRIDLLMPLHPLAARGMMSDGNLRMGVSISRNCYSLKNYSCCRSITSVNLVIILVLRWSEKFNVHEILSSQLDSS